MKRLLNAKGQGAIEYAMIAIILLAVIVASVRTPLNDALSGMFTKVKNSADNVS